MDTRLLAMLTLENPDAAVLMAANDAESGSEFGWSFRSGDSGDGAFDFLQEGETLTLTYSIDLTVVETVRQIPHRRLSL